MKLTKLSGAESTWRRAERLLPSLWVTVLSAVCLSVSALFWTYGAAFAISIFTVILKASMYATHFAFSQQV